ncbi:MAG: ABC-2 transporter permease [Bacillota bacterium]|nr:ABC-2 transporter permease [Bacillota bacterium]
MTKLLKKELKLTASPLSFLFIAFAFMALLPGYPILLGAFFICLGIFQTFQLLRDTNDILFSALLPVAKSDVVKSKYAFCVFIELCGFAVMVILTLVRMTLLKDSAVYRANALMTANLVYLGFALVVFGCFNAVFLRGFFKTAYYYGKPFIWFIVVALIVIGIAEALHHIPGFEAVNSFGFEHIPLQLSALLGGMMLFAALTLLSLKASVNNFEKIDL